MDDGLEIVPFGGPIDAAVRVPGSKSVTNRALVLAALAEGETTLTGALVCDDSERMIDALRRLGFAVQRAEAADPRSGNCTVAVAGEDGRIPRAGARLDVGNAGTAARFLTAAVALGHGRFVVDGDARMRERPIGDLVDALSCLGVRVRCMSGCPPVTVDADGLPGGEVRVSGIASSQFLSALLMVSPCAASRTTIRLADAMTSRPYVDLTLAIMRDFGVEIARASADTFVVEPARYRACSLYAIEPDASSASYVFGAAAVAGGRARVDGLTPRCRQGDAGFVRVLAEMGLEVQSCDEGVEVRRISPLRGVSATLTDMPDVAPTLAAIAPFATSPTEIRGIASARRKESDRIAALAQELARLGVPVTEHADGLTIEPCRHWRPGVVRTYNDHRIAMALALIGLRVPGLRIENPACVSKTFPGYFELLEELRP
jgi:3-phosphoshikimate 1-carboxyvinyltransferase